MVEHYIRITLNYTYGDCAEKGFYFIISILKLKDNPDVQAVKKR